jgi:sialate O-acetylesterase
MRLLPIALMIFPLAASSQLQPAKIFSDNMVLQRDQPVHIWGKGVPGQQVTVSFASENKVAAIRSDSSWSVVFSRQKANARPQSIDIRSGKEHIELKNLLIGDVWLCSGQSNMEFPVAAEAHFHEEVKFMDQPLIRLYNPAPAGRSVYGVEYTDSINKRLTLSDFYQGAGWNNCDSNSAKSMSAVGYFFAKSIIASENIPIGLINLSIGGAPIETFISRETLQNDSRFVAKVKGNWLENDNLPVWTRQRGRENIAANTTGYGDDLGPNHAYKPGFAYSCGVAPIVGMPIKGILWYQGESNSHETARVDEYADLLKLLIEDYRAKWKQPRMPFYWVQLSSIDTAWYDSKLWPGFRDQQRQLLEKVSFGGMAVCSDIGLKKSVHPTNKKEVGERLARWALNKDYHKDIVPSGPLPLTAIYKDGNVIVSFEYANDLHAAGGSSLQGFSIDGTTTALAAIKDNTIQLPAKEKPAFVYYGWNPYTDANLVNKDNLPASTFKLLVQ